jgi:hypothetical protein
VIWEWLMKQLVESLEWLSAQISGMVPPVPDWLMALPGYVRVVAGWVAVMGQWFPVEWLVIVIGAVFLTWAAGLAIKLVRIVASFLTLGGGGAG